MQLIYWVVRKSLQRLVCHGFLVIFVDLLCLSSARPMIKYFSIWACNFLQIVTNFHWHSLTSTKTEGIVLQFGPEIHLHSLNYVCVKVPV